MTTDITQGLPSEVRLLHRFRLGRLTGWSWTALIAPCPQGDPADVALPPGCSQVHFFA